MYRGILLIPVPVGAPVPISPRTKRRQQVQQTCATMDDSPSTTSTAGDISTSSNTSKLTASDLSRAMSASRIEEPSWSGEHLFRDQTFNGLGSNTRQYHDSVTGSRRHFTEPDAAADALKSAASQTPDPIAMPTHGMAAWKKQKRVGLRTFHQKDRAQLSSIGCLNQHLAKQI